MCRRMGMWKVVMALAVALAATGCSNDTGGGSETATETTGAPSDTGAVNVTEKDFAIGLDESTASSGPVDFEITNEGPSVHEFVVFQTDLAPDALPLNKDGDVDEEGKGVKHIDEVEDIAAGSTESLNVSLTTGNYVVICNLPGHYKLGMHAPLTVA